MARTQSNLIISSNPFLQTNLQTTPANAVIAQGGGSNPQPTKVPTLRNEGNTMERAAEIYGLVKAEAQKEGPVGSAFVKGLLDQLPVGPRAEVRAALSLLERIESRYGITLSSETNGGVQKYFLNGQNGRGDSGLPSDVKVNLATILSPYDIQNAFGI